MEDLSSLIYNEQVKQNFLSLGIPVSNIKSRIEKISNSENNDLEIIEYNDSLKEIISPITRVIIISMNSNKELLLISDRNCEKTIDLKILGLVLGAINMLSPEITKPQIIITVSSIEQIEKTFDILNLLVQNTNITIGKIHRMIHRTSPIPSEQIIISNVFRISNIIEKEPDFMSGIKAFILYSDEDNKNYEKQELLSIINYPPDLKLYFIIDKTNDSIQIYRSCFNELNTNIIKESIIYYSNSEDQSIKFYQPIEYTQEVFSLINQHNKVSFGQDFNQPIDSIDLSNLEYIDFGHSFNQSLDNAIISNVKTLKLGENYDLPINKLPENLECITFRSRTRFGIKLKYLPESIKVIQLKHIFVINLIPEQYRSIITVNRAY